MNKKKISKFFKKYLKWYHYQETVILELYIGETVIFLKKLRGNICEIFDFRH